MGQEYLNYMLENSEHAKVFFDMPEINKSDLEITLDVILGWCQEGGMSVTMLTDLVTGLKESL